MRDVRRAVALCHKLLSATGEVNALKAAGETVRLLGSFDDDARSAFVDALASDFQEDKSELRKVADAYCHDPSPARLAVLREAAESPRLELFRSLNVASG